MNKLTNNHHLNAQEESEGTKIKRKREWGFVEFPKFKITDKNTYWVSAADSQKNGWHEYSEIPGWQKGSETTATGRHQKEIQFISPESQNGKYWLIRSSDGGNSKANVKNVMNVVFLSYDCCLVEGQFFFRREQIGEEYLAKTKSDASTDKNSSFIDSNGFHVSNKHIFSGGNGSIGELTNRSQIRSATMEAVQEMMLLDEQFAEEDCAPDGVDPEQKTQRKNLRRILRRKFRELGAEKHEEKANAVATQHVFDFGFDVMRIMNIAILGSKVKAGWNRQSEPTSKAGAGLELGNAIPSTKVEQSQNQ
jgi:hypothetical protein